MTSHAFGGRRSRALLLLPVAALLVAARTTVTPLPETMVGVKTDHPIGETFTAKKGDIVLRAKVLDTEVVTIDAPVSVSISKFAQEVEPGTKLEPVLAPQKTESLTGASGRYYCGENLRSRSKFAEAMIGDWFSKFAAEVRFCFVDTDDDRKLDHVFLAGAKDKEFQGAWEIAPTPYTVRMMQPDDEGGELVLRVHKFKPESNKVQFMLELSKNGEPRYFDYILTVKGNQAKQTWPRIETNPKKVPYPSTFPDLLGASIAIDSVDSEKEQVTMSIRRNFPMQLFKPVTIQVQYIYIYY
ncbi:MAG: hypothetical protein IE933_05735 [Sphingomonadales bacterium]|nr:hypothetical protein [Sphingomonadales bacterium]MBD3775075.1 hypothetical protein [Paracoccaceae bacterium]